VCCKGESWHGCQRIEIGQNWRTTVADLRAAGVRYGDKERPDGLVPVFLHIGMTEKAALKALAAAGLEMLPTDREWQRRFTRRGEWCRYKLIKGHELAVNVRAGDGPGDRTVRLIIVEGMKPAGQHNEAFLCRVECELLDLTWPLEDQWYWAFLGRFSWKPGQTERRQRLRRAGQRR